jgi:anhydro-N-acetylmuramic acid kinase
MAKLFRVDRPHTTPDRRWTVGLLASSRCTHLSATLLGISGQGLQATLEVAGSLTVKIPREIVSLFASLSGGVATTVTSLAALRASLAETQASLVGELLDNLSVAPGKIIALGVDDPGLWKFTRGGPNCYMGLCDPARLAEYTGMNVIDAFPARDLAQGGQGGPVTAVARWLLLNHPNHNRVLLELGRTTRLSYLPSRSQANASAHVLSFDVGPGMSLLDALATRLSEGEHRFDPGGRLAVQGRRIDQLMEHWLADPYFDRPLPRWHPHGVRPERFLADALQMAVDNGWSVRDVLCTATYFLAETIALAIPRRLPDTEAMDELMVTGGGHRNGMLLGEISRLAKRPLVRLGELGIEDEALGPAEVATLAQLHIDQIPGNHPAITNTEVSRLLGRITPGSPQSWQRLLAMTSGQTPTVRPLRSAV